jgi:hypothetical protein
MPNIRTDPSSLFGMPETVPTKPYDWTYTTTYPGHASMVEGRNDKWVAADPEDSSQTIPMAELTRPDPILFYAEVPLFEDELHDNGSSTLLVRIVSDLLYQIFLPNHSCKSVSCQHVSSSYPGSRYASTACSSGHSIRGTTTPSHPRLPLLFGKRADGKHLMIAFNG